MSRQYQKCLCNIGNYYIALAISETPGITGNAQAITEKTKKNIFKLFLIQLYTKGAGVQTLKGETSNYFFEN